MKTAYGVRSISNPADHGFTVTPSDTEDLRKDPANNFPDTPVDSLYIIAAGNLAFMLADGTKIASFAVTVGMTIPFCATRVLATGTSATVVAMQHVDPS